MKIIEQNHVAKGQIGKTALVNGQQQLESIRSDGNESLCFGSESNSSSLRNALEIIPIADAGIPNNLARQQQSARKMPNLGQYVSADSKEKDSQSLAGGLNTRRVLMPDILSTRRSLIKNANQVQEHHMGDDAINPETLQTNRQGNNTQKESATISKQLSKKYFLSEKSYRQ